MKKLIAVTLLVAFATTAFASSVVVPWFKDDAPAGGGVIPATGSKAFISLKNTTNAPITASVFYSFGGDEASYTPSPNTFVIPANDNVAWRPAVLDADTEGPFTSIPDMVLGANDFPVGSARISWEGEPTDLQGRYVEYMPEGPAMYLLPPGK